jgi:hypothetical protein
MRIGAVLAAGLVAVASGLALVLLQADTRQAGSNYVPEHAQVLTISGAGSHCQAGQLVPAEAAFLRLLIGTFGEPTPELGVSVRSGGQAVASTRLPAGRSEGHVLLPVGPFDERHENAEVCISVRGVGDDRRSVLYGALGQVRLEWLRAGRESWLDILPTVAHRFGLGKPFLSGSWAIGLAAGLLAFAWLLALRLVVKEMDG